MGIGQINARIGRNTPEVSSQWQVSGRRRPPAMSAWSVVADKGHCFWGTVEGRMTHPTPQVVPGQYRAGASARARLTPLPRDECGSVSCEGCGTIFVPSRPRSGTARHGAGPQRRAVWRRSGEPSCRNGSGPKTLGVRNDRPPLPVRVWFFTEKARGTVTCGCLRVIVPAPTRSESGPLARGCLRRAWCGYSARPSCE